MTDVTEPTILPAAEPEGDTFTRRVARVAAYLDSMRGVTGRRGQLAILRRMGTGEPGVPPEPYWELLAKFRIPDAEDAIWSRLVPWMAAHRHDLKASPGVALFDAGVTAPRLERWLRADRETALRDVPRILARLGDSGIDWTRFATLLRDWSLRQRRALAGEYFRKAHRSSQTKTGE